ncbi:MAG: hypothetical protein ACI4EO_10170 [Blautia sp.]
MKKKIAAFILVLSFIIFCLSGCEKKEWDDNRELVLDIRQQE